VFFGRVSDLNAAIEKHIETCNSHAKPFAGRS
jgi:hypothetical protein